MLEKLQNLGLIQIVQRGSRRVYTPNPPRTVLTLLKAKEDQLKGQVEAFQEALPKLSSHYASRTFEPKVRFYQGEKIRDIYEDILNAPIDETWFIGEMSKTAQVVGETYLKHWMKRRADLQIKTRAIRSKRGEIDEPIFNATQGYLRRVRLGPEGFESPSHIIIYGDSVAIITTQEESFGVVITSRDYAHTMKNCFQEIWKISTDYIPHKRPRV
jgi:sugar-specific transcriptional regulator TrmB